MLKGREASCRVAEWDRTGSFFFLAQGSAHHELSSWHVSYRLSGSMAGASPIWSRGLAMFIAGHFRLINAAPAIGGSQRWLLCAMRLVIVIIVCQFLSPSKASSYNHGV